MPHRQYVAAELAKLFSVLAHPMRIRIVEELRKKELTVSELQQILDKAQASVSQQLAIMRAANVVAEQRHGRNVYYFLRHPELANWIIEAIPFVQPDDQAARELKSAIEATKSIWSERSTKLSKAKPRVNKTAKK
jgi:DNA-binding transcriptional ArsR family regulator